MVRQAFKDKLVYKGRQAFRDIPVFKAKLDLEPPEPRVLQDLLEDLRATPVSRELLESGELMGRQDLQVLPKDSPAFRVFKEPQEFKVLLASRVKLELKEIPV